MSNFYFLFLNSVYFIAKVKKNTRQVVINVVINVV